MPIFTLTANTYKGPVGSLQHRCPVCSATGSNLLRCSACKTVRYCSQEHQAAHRPHHKKACTQTRKARVRLEEEEDLVCNATPDAMTPANAFETHVGDFSEIPSTRDYLMARFELATIHLLLAGTLDGVDEALKHMVDMLQLCGKDFLRVQSMIPATLLRLDHDQECYDMMRWCSSRDPKNQHIFESMNLPDHAIPGSDVLEYPEFWNKTKYPDVNADLTHVVAVLLLKLKLLVDLRHLKVTRKVVAHCRLPYDIGALIESCAIRSPLSRRFIKETFEFLCETEKKLLNHIRLIAFTLCHTNEHFQFHLFKPDEALCARPDPNKSGCWMEMAFIMQHSYAAWWETEGVLDLLDHARALAARDSKEEVEAMMEGEKFKSGPDADRTAEDMLHEVSVVRIWMYIDWVVEDSSYLGPWDERPSERFMRENKEKGENAVGWSRKMKFAGSAEDSDEEA